MTGHMPKERQQTLAAKGERPKRDSSMSSTKTSRRLIITGPTGPLSSEMGMRSSSAISWAPAPSPIRPRMCVWSASFRQKRTRSNRPPRKMASMTRAKRSLSS